MIGSTTLEKEMANMKAILEKLTRESEENEACIKLQAEKIAKLTKKLEKRSTQSFAKYSDSEDLGKVSAHIEASGKERQPKKGGMPKNVKPFWSMTIEQIQYLITNAVKGHLGEGSRSPHLYTKHYTKGFDALHMPHGYGLPVPVIWWER